MSHDIPLLQLQDAWRQCERHIYHLFHAMLSIRTFCPLTDKTYTNLTDEQVQDVDQFILRYTKLQDTMGSRLFPAILGYLNEQFEDRPMLDKLNRLEKLGFIDSVEQWETVRNIRNKFAHDYPDDPNKNAAHLNFALESVSILYVMLTTISTRLNTAYPLLELGKALPAYPQD
jgi:hypothetical protein